MTVCRIASNRLTPLQGMFPRGVYWRLRQGDGEVFAVRAEDGAVQAVLAAELDRETVKLLWLWVAPEQRRQGLATLLFATLLSGGQQTGAAWLDTELPATPSYEAMLSFLLRIPGEMEDSGSRLLNTTLGEVDLGGLQKQARREVGISLGGLEAWQKKEVSRVLLAQDMPARPQYIEQCYDSYLSRMYFRDGKLCAMLLGEAGEHLCLSYLWCGNGWSHILPGLLVCCLQRAAARYPADTPLHVAATIPPAYRMAKAFMPVAKEYAVFRFRYPIG